MADAGQGKGGGLCAEDRRDRNVVEPGGAADEGAVMKKKRMKKQRISAKRKIRIMEWKCKTLSRALEFQKEQITRQHKIIKELGGKDGYEFLDTLNK